MITREAKESLIETIENAVARLEAGDGCFVEFWLYRNGLRALNVCGNNHDFFLSIGNVGYGMAVLRKVQFSAGASSETIRTIVDEAFSYLPPAI